MKILIYMFLRLLKSKVSISLIFLLCFSNIQSSELATKKVQILHENLIITNFSEEPFEKKVSILNEIIGDVFNSRKMISFIYGRKWKDLNEETRNELNRTFQKYISFNYVKRFNNIKNLKFEFLEFEKINDQTLLVKTFLHPSNEEKISLDYIISKENNKWMIFDVLLNGSISEIATKKSEFNNIIKVHGASGLIEIISNKISNYNK